MTTIATDGLSIAADGLSAYRGTIVSEMEPKLRRLKDGRILGSCGSVQDAACVARWLEEAGDKPDVDNDFGALLLSPNGVEWLSSKLEPQRAMLPAAMGSGMDFAIGAMLAGATPREAVEIAAARDVNTGGSIVADHLSARAV